ncbi:ExeM/NucH family extracellular endonuclease [Luteimonas fraxinea]|uniref:ExeM/NucH family extracellular endonuclease n=1 Tax=Luteimonas fraxinea TaxID=2901869 RepID=A0ABS8UEX1_9GAMM|nr:ExeM/NucH family extracellular endonuclease [Luteimonas fraxinea]MCD9097264.1 ExeM/NucH family extracellular endonuclease [Luteimonas fraxinea]MCD9125171.1 ExeM/NucH family extracellular endonuclease [Luteimonas fraxinea]UHH11528.1 ExeM/NucH family extracellular endonuclease [Luteimonas fraxinea]
MFRPTAALLAVALLAACQSTAPAPGSATITIGELHRVPMAGPAQIEGRVTAGFEGLGGFFVQDAGDGDATTPDAVFVQVPTGLPLPALGAHVRALGLREDGDTVHLRAQRVDVLPTPAPAIAARVLDAPPADWSALAGTWVRIDAPLTLTGQHERARRGTLAASFDGRLFTPTEIARPGADAARVASDNARRRVLLDDGREDAPTDGQLWYLPDTAQALRSGSVLTGIEGVVDHRHGAWRLQLTAPLQPQPASRPPAPVVGGDVRIAAFNLQNLFNGDGRGGGFPTPRGARTPEELTRQIEGLVATIAALDVDVAALMELENDGYDAQSSIAALVDALNAEGPAHDWRFVDAGEGPGTNAIRVGLIYRDTRVRTKGQPATLDGGPFAELSRVPLAQAFVPLRNGRANGLDFSVVAVHFKSKGCGEAEGPNLDQRDGQACWNAARVDSAQRLRDWLATAPTGTGDRVAVVGDFNAYAMEDPVRVFTDAGWRDPFAGGDGDTHYSFVFDGQAGRLDHLLLGPSLAARVAGAAKWHSNADEPVDTREREAAGPWRSSDHDPLVVGLRLRGR